MHKILTLLLFLAFSTLSFSQTITLKGKITDDQNQPLESATVYLTSAKDSSVVDYTITAKNGQWELRTRKVTQPVFLKVSFIGMADHTERLESINEDRDFGTVKMADLPTELNEVVIKADIPPIRIKSDTLEFNASSFKVRPDANVETLLKQLPGVEIDENGKITVNGKEVNEVLVNGKPFFDKDGKIALQNLPAEIIDKVQVTDTKSKEEKLSGEAASGNNSSINLTIQDDKNKGMFGKIMGGYGSSGRYESSGLLNYFKDKQKFSILASSNNINSTGFSMNEIFDNMSGGRSRSVSVSDNGSFNINGMQFGSDGSGITLSNMVGLNYTDEWTKGVEGTVSYFFNNAHTENDNRTRQINLLPDEEDTDNPGTFINNSFTTESTSKTDTDRYAHSFNGDFEFKIDSTATISFVPKFTTGNSKNKNTGSRFSVDENEVLLNESNSYTFSESDNKGFNSNLYFYKAFKKKQRALGVSFNNDNRKDDNTYLNRSETYFYKDDNNDGITETTADIRDQVRYNRQLNDQYQLALEYFEPIMDSTRLKLKVEYRKDLSLEDRVGYDFDAVTGGYTTLNPLLTNYLTSTTNTVIPQVGLNIQKKGLQYGVEMGTRITNFDNFSTYLGNDYKVEKDYLLPYAEAYLSKRFTKSMGMWTSYSYNINFPQASQVLPVEDISNPLYITRGNPDLDPNKYHNFYASLHDYDYATRSGWSVYGGASIYDSQIISNTFIDESARYTTTYTNVSGTYDAWLGGNWNKSVKKEANTYRYGLGISTGIAGNKGFTNGEMYESFDYSITPRVNFTYEYGELVTLNPTYNFTYREQNYSNYIIDEASNVVHRFALQATTYWPKHVVFGNDFSYTYNSNIADGFRKDFFLWNTSLGYNFLNDKLLFKVKVYDLLNQIVSATRSIGPTSITDEQNTVLKRYVMFSLTFKLQKFGGKESKEGTSFWFW